MGVYNIKVKGRRHDYDIVVENLPNKINTAIDDALYLISSAIHPFVETWEYVKIENNIGLGEKILSTESEIEIEVINDIVIGNEVYPMIERVISLAPNTLEMNSIIEATTTSYRLLADMDDKTLAELDGYTLEELDYITE